MAKLSEETRVPLKYLEAMEEGNYAKLPPAKAFRLAYIKEVTSALNLNYQDCLEQIEREGILKNPPTVHTGRYIKLFPFSSLSIFARNILAVSFVFLFAVYLIWQVRGVLEPPKLTVYSPIEGYVATQKNTLVEGETEKESRLTVNGKDIMVNEQGKFQTRIDLTDGVNTIVVEATKKHGKTTRVTRHLVAKKSTGQISLK